MYSDRNIDEIELQTLNCVQSSFGWNNRLYRSLSEQSSIQNPSAKLSLNPYFLIEIVPILFYTTFYQMRISEWVWPTGLSLLTSWNWRITSFCRWVQASHWSGQVTWPEYFSLIGWYCSGWSPSYSSWPSSSALGKNMRTRQSILGSVCRIKLWLLLLLTEPVKEQ